MNKNTRWKKPVKIASLIVLAIVGIVLLYVACIKIMTIADFSRLRAPGTLVNVDGHKIHIYGEGSKKDGDPTFLLLPALATQMYMYKNVVNAVSPFARIVILERAGVGYSEDCPHGREIDTMLHETRTALNLAGETGPYVLLPHSIGGFEARYWALTFPNEVSKIIGLDMLLPEYELSYDEGDTVDSFTSPTVCALVQVFGLGRWEALISDMIPFNEYRQYLSPTEAKQDKLLMRTTFMSQMIAEEVQWEKSNAQKVLDSPFPSCPIVLFVSDPAKTDYIGSSWRSAAHQLADQHSNVRVIDVDCDHMVHLYKLNEIIEEINHTEKTCALN